MRNLISKLILLIIPIFIFIIWLVIHNQDKVNKTIKRQTTEFNSQFKGFNQQFSNRQASKPAPARPARKIANNQELNKNINSGIGNF